jgi:hypothetical protein
MSQHDLIIDNGPGLGVRTDIQAALQALASTSLGPTEPTPSYAGQLWLDTSGGGNGILKQRNLSNAGWIALNTTAFAMPSGSVVASVIGTYKASANITTVIPQDDTIPQVSEGTEIISVSITPKSTTNKLRCRFQGSASGSLVVGMAAAIFVNGAANAVAANLAVNPVASGQAIITVEYEFVPGATSVQTISVRAGPTNAATIRFNGSNTARLFGGVALASLVVEEIQG